MTNVSEVASPPSGQTVNVTPNCGIKKLFQESCFTVGKESQGFVEDF